MIRFAVKSAFLLGLVAFLLPDADGGEASSFSLLGAAAGFREAVADLTGFCDRAPTACLAGREAATFAAARIGEGARLAYDYVSGDGSAETRTAGTRPRSLADDDGDPLPPADEPPVIVEVTPRSTDPVFTGSLPPSSAPAPQPYRAPQPAAARTAATPAAPRVTASEGARRQETPRVDEIGALVAALPRSEAAPPARHSARSSAAASAVPGAMRMPAVGERPQADLTGTGVVAFGPRPSPAPKNNRAFAQIPAAEVPLAAAAGRVAVPVPSRAPRG